MPKYFPHQSKYSSFTRQVNGWNFRRITRGPDRFTYYHMFFIRDFPQEAMKMTRGLSDDICELPLSNQSEHDFLKMNCLPHNSIGCASNIPLDSPYPLSPHSNGINNVMPYHRPDMQLPYYHRPPSCAYQEQLYSSMFQQPLPQHFRQLSNGREVQYLVNTGQHNASTSDNEWRDNDLRQPSNHDKYHTGTSDDNLSPDRPIRAKKEREDYFQHHAQYSTNDDQYHSNRQDNIWRSKHPIQPSSHNQLHRVTPDYQNTSSSKFDQYDKPSRLSFPSLSFNKFESSSDLSCDHYPEYQKSYAKDYRKEVPLSLLNSSDNDFWEPIKEDETHQPEQHPRFSKPEKFKSNEFMKNSSYQLSFESKCPAKISIANVSDEKSNMISSSYDESDQCIKWNHSLLSTEV